MSPRFDRATTRRRFVQYFAASPLFAHCGTPALAQNTPIPARLPDPMVWGPRELDNLISDPKQALDVFDFEPVAKRNVPPARLRVANRLQGGLAISRQWPACGAPTVRIPLPFDRPSTGLHCRLVQPGRPAGSCSIIPVFLSTCSGTCTPKARPRRIVSTAQSPAIPVDARNKSEQIRA